MDLFQTFLKKILQFYWSKIFHNSIVLHCWHASILFALGIGRGDEVIVPAQTHTATAHAVELAGAKPVLLIVIVAQEISIPKNTGKNFKKTKAICVVHFLGIPVDMKKINSIAKKNKLFVLEDCALSLGASYNKVHTGLLGDAGVFSFLPS